MKKLWNAVLAAVAIAVALPAEAGTLKLAHSTWVGYGPFYIARDKGFFKEEGVEVELSIIEDTPLKMGAFMAGQLDMVASTADEFPIYLKEGKSIRYVLAVDNSKGGDGIVATKDIATVADLKGKKVAFEQGSVSQFFFNAILKEAGMTQDDVEAINMTATDAGTAFASKNVDAAVTWEPALSQGANSEHGKLLVSSADKPGLITDVVAVSAETAASRPDDVKAFVRGWYRALDFLANNPDEGYAIMSRGVGGWLANPEEFKATVTGIEYLDKAKNEAFFGTAEAPGQIYKTLGFALDIWKGFGRIQVEVKPEDLVDHSFIGG